MITIITAIYNQLAMNQLFYESLVRYTHYPFELIIIDNSSTDGSKEYFEAQAHTKVISTGANYSYPYCQNLGIKEANYDTFAFLNNDIIVSPQWDKKMLDIMDMHGLEVATCSATERIENATATKKQRLRWNRIRHAIGVFGYGYTALSCMHRLMYGNWEEYTQKRYQQFGNQVKEGFSGSSVLIKKSAFDKIGLWDERLQAADFDLFLRTRKRFEEVGDIKPVHFALGVYVAHFIRLTAKMKFPPFADKQNLMSISEKWDSEFVEKSLVLIDK